MTQQEFDDQKWQKGMKVMFDEPKYKDRIWELHSVDFTTRTITGMSMNYIKRMRCEKIVIIPIDRNKNLIHV